MEDLVLLTIDCWREDAINEMERLLSYTQSWNSRHLLTSGAATNGVFPAIFASTTELDAYEATGELVDGLSSLPSLLTEAGYTTGGFVASNPFLGKWSNHFDTFWNDGMSATDPEENRTGSSAKRLSRLLTFQPRVSDDHVLQKGLNWWASQTPPRFLWVHLMEPHAPYYPGIHSARQIGLLRSYRSLIENARRETDVPDWMRAHLKKLYYKCIENLDEKIVSFLQSLPDDTDIILTADHGEEFDHGYIGHAQLYHETTRCPYITNSSLLAPPSSAIRQLDIAPTVLHALDVPGQLGGRGHLADYATTPPQRMLSISEKLERIWVGVHDESHKLILNYDWDRQLHGVERYSVEEDPHETSSLGSLPNEDQFLEHISPIVMKDDFLERRAVGTGTGLDGDVESRLSELGYI